MPTVVESPELVPPAQLAREFDLRRLPPDFYENPFPYYAALRYHEPVKQLPGGGYLLTRYRDVEYVYKNPKLFSSDKKVEFKPKYGDSPLYEHHTTSLVFNDPPLAHARAQTDQWRAGLPARSLTCSRLDRAGGQAADRDG